MGLRFRRILSGLLRRALRVLRVRGILSYRSLLRGLFVLRPEVTSKGSASRPAERQGISLPSPHLSNSSQSPRDVDSNYRGKHFHREFYRVTFSIVPRTRIQAPEISAGTGLSWECFSTRRTDEHGADGMNFKSFDVHLHRQ